MGTLAYSLEKIINILDISDDDAPAFTKAFDDPGSDVGRAYQKGIDKSDYTIDMKLFEKAKDGDLRAIELYEEKKRIQMAKGNKSREKRENALNPQNDFKF